LAVALTALLVPLAAAARPHAVISLERSTLRLERGPSLGRRVFPVGVGRWSRKGPRSPVGTWLTGPDPGDRAYYLPARWLPAFHRGHPFLRLEVKGRERRRQAHPFGIHGPVTPSLIWGRVSGGCIRMRAADAKELYRFAARHPRMPVRIIRGPDLVAGVPVRPDPVRPDVPGCPEAAVGARRLRQLQLGGSIHDRTCGGVDHWYALELQGGDVIAVSLTHGGALRAELYGIRAISTVARGVRGFTFRVPLAPRNRGNRYLRVVATSKVVPYTLQVTGM
jgi:hypothetical protein